MLARALRVVAGSACLSTQAGCWSVCSLVWCALGVVVVASAACFAMQPGWCCGCCCVKVLERVLKVLQWLLAVLVWRRSLGGRGAVVGHGQGAVWVLVQVLFGMLSANQATATAPKSCLASTRNALTSVQKVPGQHRQTSAARNRQKLTLHLEHTKQHLEQHPNNTLTNGQQQQRPDCAAEQAPPASATAP